MKPGAPSEKNLKSEKMKVLSGSNPQAI